MNTKNNNRRKNSVSKIEKAFTELLSEKEISEITVSEICQKAEVNRSTFYANYFDIEDLSEKVKKSLFEEFSYIYNNETICSTNSNTFLKLFYHIKSNPLLYKAYFKLGAGFTEKEIKFDKSLAENFFDNKYIDYHIEFFRNGINAVIRKWLENGCKETPEEIEEIIKTEYQGRI